MIDEVDMDALYTEKSSKLPNYVCQKEMKEEIRRMAEMDGISINSAICAAFGKARVRSA